MSWMVDSRCAIAIVVRPAISDAQRVADEQLGLGVDARRRLVENSTRGSNASARANDSSCFCPTESVEPRSATALS